MNDSPIAVFEDVVKDYPSGFLGRSRLRALDGVSFQLERGEVFGLLGPNRAGKTTLVKMLLSLCRPTQGRVLRLGRPTTELSTLERVGYVHENPAFPRYLTARELLWYYGTLGKISSDKLRLVIPELLGRVGLADRVDEPIARFSKGMVQRLALAQALLNHPDLLVLDEPNEGLDLSGRALVHETVRSIAASGKTVLLISHVIFDIERLCDRIAILTEGRLEFLGAVGEFTHGGAISLEEGLTTLYARTNPFQIAAGSQRVHAHAQAQARELEAKEVAK